MVYSKFLILNHTKAIFECFVVSKGEFAKDEFWALRTLNISPLCRYELVCPSLAWASQSVESLVLHPVRASWLQFSPNHPPFHHPSPSLQLAPETICNICMHIRRPTDRNTHTNILTETTINTTSNFSPFYSETMFSPSIKFLWRHLAKCWVCTII